MQVWCGIWFDNDIQGILWKGLWYGMVWYGMVWYGMVWYGMVWNCMEWNCMVMVWNDIAYGIWRSHL